MGFNRERKGESRVPSTIMDEGLRGADDIDGSNGHVAVSKLPTT